jgi:hypothetical protein
MNLASRVWGRYTTNRGDRKKLDDSWLCSIWVAPQFEALSHGWNPDFDRRRTLMAVNLTAKRCAMVLVLASSFAMTSAAVRSAQEPGADQGLVILDFKPAFDDLMTMLVQPRHLKLYYAGQEENWVLARFQLNELRGAFTRIGDTIPDYGFFPVDDAVEATMFEPMDTMLAAIDAGDMAAFNRAYVGLTAGCNACHEAMHFPFLVMKIPDANAAAMYSNQDFTPVEGLQGLQ